MPSCRVVRGLVDRRKSSIVRAAGIPAGCGREPAFDRARCPVRGSRVLISFEGQEQIGAAVIATSVRQRVTAAGESGAVTCTGRLDHLRMEQSERGLGETFTQNRYSDIRIKQFASIAATTSARPPPGRRESSGCTWMYQGPVGVSPARTRTAAGRAIFCITPCWTVGRGPGPMSCHDSSDRRALNDPVCIEYASFHSPARHGGRISTAHLRQW